MSNTLLFLKSEDELLAYFQRFLADKPKWKRLDGADAQAGAGAVMAVFRFSIDDRRYKLLGGTTRQAIEEFVKIAEEHGGASMALKTFQKGPVQTLILSTHRKPDGWQCLPFTDKAKEKLRDAA